MKYSIIVKHSGTMRNWLHFCNFSVIETKKGIYFDGHERADVVKVNILKQFNPANCACVVFKVL